MELTESFLRKEYLEYGRRVSEIAGKANYSMGKVRKELKRFGLIEKRDRMILAKVKELLKPRSFGLRTPHIAKEIGENTQLLGCLLSKSDEVVNITNRSSRASWMLRENVPSGGV